MTCSPRCMRCGWSTRWPAGTSRARKTSGPPCSEELRREFLLAVAAAARRCPPPAARRPPPPAAAAAGSSREGGSRSRPLSAAGPLPEPAAAVVRSVKEEKETANVEMKLVRQARLRQLYAVEAEA